MTPVRTAPCCRHLYRFDFDIRLLDRGPSLAGIGGQVNTRTIDATLRQGSFWVTMPIPIIDELPGPNSMPSILGRDVIDGFALFMERRTDRVLLLDESSLRRLSACQSDITWSLLTRIFSFTEKAATRLQITRQHNRNKQQAKAWVDVKLSEMLTQFGDSVSDTSYNWRGDTMEFAFRAAGLVSFSGTLAVTDTDFHLDLPFPFLAKSFEPRAEVEVNRWLDDNLPP